MIGVTTTAMANKQKLKRKCLKNLDKVLGTIHIQVLFYNLHYTKKNYLNNFARKLTMI
jgi:hypothetical protein